MMMKKKTKVMVGMKFLWICQHGYVAGDGKSPYSVSQKDQFGPNIYLDHVLRHVDGEVRSVKMWRKDDFTRLKNKAAQYGIVVESVQHLVVNAGFGKPLSC